MHTNFRLLWFYFFTNKIKQLDTVLINIHFWIFIMTQNILTDYIKESYFNIYLHVLMKWVKCLKQIHKCTSWYLLKYEQFQNSLLLCYELSKLSNHQRRCYGNCLPATKADLHSGASEQRRRGTPVLKIIFIISM